MRRSYVIVLGIFVGISSCGSESDGSPDTALVAPRPQAPSAESAAAPDPGVSLAFVGFAGDDRFAIWEGQDPADRRWSLVFDRADSRSFWVRGAPIAAPRSTGDRYQELGLAAAGARRDVLQDRRGRIVVRDGADARVIDLPEEGRVVATMPDAPDGLSLDPDGQALAAFTADRFAVLRFSDGTLRSEAVAFGDPAGVAWGEGTVSLAGRRALALAFLDTLQVQTFTPARPGDVTSSAVFARSKDGSVVAIAPTGNDLEPKGTVEVYRRTGARIAAIPSAFVSSLTVDATGGLVVWAELDERLEAGGSTHPRFHTIDVATGAHRAFFAKGPGCMAAPETIEKVEGGRITTDASCSLGCPSVRWSHRTITYDARTGSVLSDVSVAETKSWNEEQEELRARVEQTAGELGVPVGEMVHVDGTDRVLARSSLVHLLTRSTIDLEDASVLAPETTAFSPNGALVAATRDGRPRLWDAATGWLLLRD